MCLQIYEIYIYSIDYPSCLTPVLSPERRRHILKKMSLIVFRHKFYPRIACGAHFQFSNHDYLKRLFQNCYLKIVSSFSSLTLHTVNFLLWKKIITVSRPTTFRIFLMGRSGCLTKRGKGGGFPRKPKSLNFPLLLNKNMTYWEIPHIGKKRYLY